MKMIFLFLLVLPSLAHALEAVVMVLEAPILEEKSRYSKVVQYLRKGDVIKIHPSVGNDAQYDYLAPDPKKQLEVRKKLSEKPEWKEDQVFPGDESLNGHIEDEFIPVLDRRGRRAYVIAEHIYVYFNDKREFREARFNNKDRTDYRLQEPLLRDYPLKREGGIRGQALLGMNQPYDQSYPYKQTVKAKSYNQPIDFNVSFLRNFAGDEQDRYFYGINIGFRYYKNNYEFTDNERKSFEKTIKAGVGPIVTWDVYKGEKNRFALYTRANLYLLNLLTISQSDINGNQDTRKYQGASVSPALGVQYHRKNFLEDLDFIIGSSIETEISAKYRAQTGATFQDWWRHGGNDRFQPGPSFIITGYLGVQQTY